MGAIVNLEVRGTGGPSLLFETVGPGEVVVRRFAERAPHPVGNSLLSTVYSLLPNDTDLTVLRRLGVPGANLAFVHGAIRYHTPRDDIAHLDPRSVQHQGANALPLVRGLAEPTPDGAKGQAVWFDLLGLGVVRFPEGAALPLAIAALLLALAAAAVDVRRARTSTGRVALGVRPFPGVWRPRLPWALALGGRWASIRFSGPGWRRPVRWWRPSSSRESPAPRSPPSSSAAARVRLAFAAGSGLPSRCWRLRSR